MELVLFEVDDGENNLPDEDTIMQMKHIADLNKLTYTVHLPLDLKLGGSEGERKASIRKVHQVINNTKNPATICLCPASGRKRPPFAISLPTLAGMDHAHKGWFNGNGESDERPCLAGGREPGWLPARLLG